MIMIDHTVVEIVRKMDALNLWEKVKPYSWAIKPFGTAFPYFCTVALPKDHAARVRIIMLEGWQTLNDYSRMVHSSDSIYTSSMELPHYEVIITQENGIEFYRYDLNFLPKPFYLPDHLLVSRILWEIFGLLMRAETDSQLFLSFADRTSVFARVEIAEGQWVDRPLKIVSCPPPKEVYKIDPENMKGVKDLPLAADFAVEVEFSLLPGMGSRHTPPRSVYTMFVLDAKTGAVLFDDRAIAGPGFGFMELWQNVPDHLLQIFLKMKRLPGQIKVRSSRMFCAIRPICLELPVKISLHDRLENIEKAITEATRWNPPQ